MWCLKLWHRVPLNVVTSLRCNMSSPLSSTVCLCPKLLPNHVRSNPAHVGCPHSPINYSNPENGGNMFVRNIGIPVLEYAASRHTNPVSWNVIVGTPCSLKPSRPAVGHRRSVGTVDLSPGLTGRDVKLTTHFHLALRFRMNGVMTLFPHTPSWRWQEQLIIYVHICIYAYIHIYIYGWLRTLCQGRGCAF